MRFRIIGEKENPVIVFIPGSCITVSTCYGKITENLKGKYCCVMCELDGHEEDNPSTFETLDKEAEQIEEYVNREFPEGISCLTGLSLGATICVRLLERGKINPAKVLLDGVYCVDTGAVMTKISGEISKAGIHRLKKGKSVPDKVVESVFGKGNTGIVKMLYPKVSDETVDNVCTQVYRYKLEDSISGYKGKIMCIRGEYEPIPKKSYKALKQFLPQIKEEVMQKKGHSQFLYEYPVEYARFLDRYTWKD